MPACQGLVVAAAAEAPDPRPPDSPAVTKYSVYDSPKHLLHGVLHYNGFGHLARVNGVPPTSSRPLPLRTGQDFEDPAVWLVCIRWGFWGFRGFWVNDRAVGQLSQCCAGLVAG